MAGPRAPVVGDRAARDLVHPRPEPLVVAQVADARAACAGRCPAGRRRRRWRRTRGARRTDAAAPRAPATRRARVRVDHDARSSARAAGRPAARLAPSGLTRLDRRRGDVVLRARARHPVADERAAAPASTSTRTSANPAARRSASQLVDRRRAGDAAGERRDLRLQSASGSGAIATTSQIASRPPGLSTRNASRNTAALSGDQVDHAVREDDVDASRRRPAGARSRRAGTRRSRPSTLRALRARLA